MIRIRDFKDRDDQKMFVGSIYKSMSEYMAGQTLEIKIEPNMDLKAISSALHSISEVIASADSIIDADEEDDEYPFDPDDPADRWKR